MLNTPSLTITLVAQEQAFKEREARGGRTAPTGFMAGEGFQQFLDAKEEDRRKAIPAPAKVYTNKDLAPVPAGSTPPPAKAGEAAKDADKDLQAGHPQKVAQLVETKVLFDRADRAAHLRQLVQADENPVSLALRPGGCAEHVFARGNIAQQVPFVARAKMRQRVYLPPA